MVHFHRGVGAEPLLPWNRMIQNQNAAFPPNQYQMLAGPGAYPPRRDDRGGRQVSQCGLQGGKPSAAFVCQCASQGSVSSYWISREVTDRAARFNLDVSYSKCL